MNTLDRTNKVYHREGQPFQCCNLRVQWATELLSMRANGTFTARKCLIDMETGEEVTTIDAGGYVFEAGVLVYDPKNSYDNPGLGAVYAMHLDQDTPGLRQLVGLAGLTVAQPSTPQKGQP